MIKIGVISDTHIHSALETLPKELIDALKGTDIIIHAGDLVSLSVLEELKSICKEVYAVCGNMDPDSIKSKLPEKKIINVGKYKIGIMHGLGSPKGLVSLLKDRFNLDKVDVIIFGHSHAPYNEKHDNVLFFNPGSVTDKIFAPYNSYGIIEVNDTIKARIVKL